MCYSSGFHKMLRILYVFTSMGGTGWHTYTGEEAWDRIFFFFFFFFGFFLGLHVQHMEGLRLGV